MAIIETYPEGIYRKNKDGDIILGKAIRVFIDNGCYHVTDLKIFQDGKIDCWTGLIDLEQFKEEVKRGWVRTTAPKGKIISFTFLGEVLATDMDCVEEDELIKEVRDTIDELNDRPTTSEVCRDIYAEYQKNPTEENKTDLKDAYEKIPKHMRCFVLGDMDVKDHPIKDIIYS